MKKTRFSALLALLLAASAGLPVSAHTPQTLTLTAQAVAAECPEASFGVQIALAAVIFNRMADARFGDTAAQVIFAADFLTCTRTGRIALPVPDAVLEKARAAVQYAAEGMDPTGGALWYGGGETGRHSDAVWFGDEGYLFWG